MENYAKEIRSRNKSEINGVSGRILTCDPFFRKEGTLYQKVTEVNVLMNVFFLRCFFRLILGLGNQGRRVDHSRNHFVGLGQCRASRPSNSQPIADKI